ncbi:MAG: His/Gly/Thr/Pro-type tRNA ligase C-terminal domain-containing protein, partial [Actinomycetales bacterium]
VIVSAMAGAMGGSVSEEFLAPTEVGEDTFVRCATCSYAANVEAVVTPVPDEVDATDTPAAHVEDTPDTPTIDALVEISNARADLARADRPWTSADTLKNVVFMVTEPSGAKAPLVVGLPGNREVDMKRLEAVLHPAVARPFEEADFAAHGQLVKGYIGPQALGQAHGIRFLVDPRVVQGTRWITGANLPGRHVYDLVMGRDFEADGTIEVAEVLPGDQCPACGDELLLARGIEIGHIFQLGRKYAQALGLSVLNEHGELVTVTMGSYGIGVSRAVAAIAEQSHDEHGLIWPREVAPADVHLIATGKDDAAYEAAQTLGEQLQAAGIRVLYDDRRSVSPGVKFNDSELIGVPTIVIVGKRLVDGVVEVKDRASGDRVEVPLAEAPARIAALIAVVPDGQRAPVGG